MDDAAFWHRLQFAFTITYHYLFPQLTMGSRGSSCTGSGVRCEPATNDARTVGPVHERSERLARLLWLITAVLFVVVSAETTVVRPELFQSLLQRPLAWMSGVVVGAAVWALSTGLRRHAESLFPVVLHSTLSPEHSMTAYSGATAGRGLRTALFWWPVAVALALTYFFVIMRIYAGKVRPSQGTQGY
ncbi:MAG TPA: hypothetical protein VFB99_06950 [Vicinamibacterales bacterium]|jgi:cytochrome bd-type quinol oxidase subunit 2|nr:hypothetical protein [Vicinamibacterales bacterium]